MRGSLTLFVSGSVLFLLVGCGADSEIAAEPTEHETQTMQPERQEQPEPEPEPENGDLPLPLGTEEGRALELGMLASEVFAQIGESEWYEGGPAVSRVGAERCYTYRVPGTTHESELGLRDYDSWWLCFDDADRLVFKRLWEKTKGRSENFPPDED